ncbi:hypothetical protein [Pseudomonas nitroreducens]|uniref:Uncharacterized protein n=1 Tax=Pseudomonas nitroreducens TaxID=46680 RepID=A0A6G6J733_PSENT|nr:hypothetical protein [Pseudomonas nitroreducens]QIE91139.1 hypothetical protein G5B91_32805 [Pseudomonas nitroreducens]
MDTKLDLKTLMTESGNPDSLDAIKTALVDWTALAEEQLTALDDFYNLRVLLTQKNLHEVGDANLILKQLEARLKDLVAFFSQKPAAAKICTDALERVQSIIASARTMTERLSKFLPNASTTA